MTKEKVTRVTRRFFTGDMFVMILLLIFFWPAALYYYFANSEEREIQRRQK